MPKSKRALAPKWLPPPMVAKVMSSLKAHQMLITMLPPMIKAKKIQKSEIKKGMVFAVECWKGAEDGSGAARIEEEVVVTDDGCEIITNFPSDHLISCGLPGCEFY